MKSYLFYLLLFQNLLCNVTFGTDTDTTNLDNIKEENINVNEYKKNASNQKEILKSSINSTSIEDKLDFDNVKEENINVNEYKKNASNQKEILKSSINSTGIEDTLDFDNIEEEIININGHKKNLSNQKEILKNSINSTDITNSNISIMANTVSVEKQPKQILNENNKNIKTTLEWNNQLLQENNGYIEQILSCNKYFKQVLKENNKYFEQILGKNNIKIEFNKSDIAKSTIPERYSTKEFNDLVNKKKIILYEILNDFELNYNILFTDNAFYNELYKKYKDYFTYIQNKINNIKNINNSNTKSIVSYNQTLEYNILIKQKNIYKYILSIMEGYYSFSKTNFPKNNTFANMIIEYFNMLNIILLQQYIIVSNIAIIKGMDPLLDVIRDDSNIYYIDKKNNSEIRSIKELINASYQEYKNKYKEIYNDIQKFKNDFIKFIKYINTLQNSINEIKNYAYNNENKKIIYLKISDIEKIMEIYKKIRRCCNFYKEQKNKMRNIMEKLEIINNIENINKKYKETYSSIHEMQKIGVDKLYNYLISYKNLSSEEKQLIRDPISEIVKLCNEYKGQCKKIEKKYKNLEKEIINFSKNNISKIEEFNKNIQDINKKLNNIIKEFYNEFNQLSLSNSDIFNKRIEKFKQKLSNNKLKINNQFSIEDLKDNNIKNKEQRIIKRSNSL